MSDRVIVEGSSQDKMNAGQTNARNRTQEIPAVIDRIFVEGLSQDKEDAGKATGGTSGVASLRGLPNMGDKRLEEFFKDPRRIGQELGRSRARERSGRLITAANLAGE